VLLNPAWSLAWASDQAGLAGSSPAQPKTNKKIKNNRKIKNKK
jgi:hypothetical protein